MQRIFLIGFMGAGKTTIGKALSAKMKCSFVDLDFFIERRYHKTIRQIFDEKGESAFREIEQKILREVAEFENVVISTGGGTPCFYQNMLFMNKNGLTVFLDVSTPELTKRISSNIGVRPMLKNYADNELTLFIEETVSRRRPYYEQAQLIFHTEIQDISALCQQLNQQK